MKDVKNIFFVYIDILEMSLQVFYDIATNCIN